MKGRGLRTPEPHAAVDARRSHVLRFVPECEIDRRRAFGKHDLLIQIARGGVPDLQGCSIRSQGPRIRKKYNMGKNPNALAQPADQLRRCGVPDKDLASWIVLISDARSASQQF